MFKITDDVLFYLLTLVDEKSLLKFSLTCKKFQTMASHNALWRPFVQAYIKRNHPRTDLSTIEWRDSQFNFKMLLIQSKLMRTLLWQLSKKIEAIEGQIEWMCRVKYPEPVFKDIGALNYICAGLGGGCDSAYYSDGASSFSFKGIRLFFLEKTLKNKVKKRDAVYNDTTKATIENKLIPKTAA
jgi:hypothetical protein